MESARIHETAVSGDTELDALIAAARGHVMSDAEVRAQRRSFVIGQLMLSNPEMSREKAEGLVDDVIARIVLPPASSIRRISACQRLIDGCEARCSAWRAACLGLVLVLLLVLAAWWGLA